MTKRRVYYDCEFLEDGRTTELISIGMVDEEGHEYYAVNADAPLSRRWWTPWRPTRIERHPWLMENVVPNLPQGHGDWKNHMPKNWLIDLIDHRVKPKAVIADEVRRFILGYPGEPELWAWYAAYDHVALCQLWGTMMDLPEGIPMYTNDLKQEAARLGDPAMPPQASREHNALNDARHNLVIHRYLKRKEAIDRGF